MGSSFLATRSVRAFGKANRRSSILSPYCLQFFDWCSDAGCIRVIRCWTISLYGMHSIWREDFKISLSLSESNFLYFRRWMHSRTLWQMAISLYGMHLLVPVVSRFRSVPLNASFFLFELLDLLYRTVHFSSARQRTIFEQLRPWFDMFSIMS